MTCAAVTEVTPSIICSLKTHNGKLFFVPYFTPAFFASISSSPCRSCFHRLEKIHNRLWVVVVVGLCFFYSARKFTPPNGRVISSASYLRRLEGCVQFRRRRRQDDRRRNGCGFAAWGFCKCLNCIKLITCFTMVLYCSVHLYIYIHIKYLSVYQTRPIFLPVDSLRITHFYS